MLRSMLSGRLKRNLKRCRTLSALRVESALSFRPRTSWKRVSAVSLAPVEKREGEGGKRKWESGRLQKQISIPHFSFNSSLCFFSCAVCYLTRRPCCLEESDTYLLVGQFSGSLASWVAFNILLKKKSSIQNKNPWRKASKGLNRGILHIFHVQIRTVKIEIYLFYACLLIQDGMNCSLGPQVWGCGDESYIRLGGLFTLVSRKRTCLLTLH